VPTLETDPCGLHFENKEELAAAGLAYAQAPASALSRVTNASESN